MGNPLYKRFNLLAKRLIAKYGYNKVKIVRQVKNGNSWENTFEQRTFTTDCLIVPSSKYSKESFRINGKYDIVESNYVAFIPHTNFVPTVNDKIVTKSEEFTILSVIKVNPDGSQEILYKMELK